jgi:predicted metalloprotease
MRFLHIIAAAWLMLLCALAVAHADKRVALVIGNAAYRHADKLANPVNDAQGMRDALKKLGFDVIYGENLDLKSLRQTTGKFAGALNGADVALVYFAGHGATFGDTPYVVPVDAEFSSLDEVPYELVPVEMLIGELRRVKGVRIAILDACRDNGPERELKRPAARGGEVTRGLGPMRNPSGLIIAYATQYMETAADDAGGAGGWLSWGNSAARHSPFTAALLNNIATPGLDVTDMLRKVGREVDAATAGRQRPEISISMYDQYALAPLADGGPGTAGVPPAALPPPAPPAGPAADEAAWSFLKDTRDAELLRRFIAQYPASPRRREAEERLRAIEQTSVAMTAPPVRPAEAAKPAGSPCGGGTTVLLASPQCVTILGNITREWTDIFEKDGRTYKKPVVVFYSGQTSAACGGAAQSAMGPFSCAADQQIYLDTSFFKEIEKRFRSCEAGSTSCQFAQAYVIAHEIGHHVQNLLGILPKVQQQQRMDKVSANQLQVRVELQADCLAGVWARHENERLQKEGKPPLVEPGDVEAALQTAAAVGDDTLQRKTTGRVVPDSFTHGSSEQRQRWFSTGFQESTVSACNTFRTG